MGLGLVLDWRLRGLGVEVEGSTFWAIDEDGVSVDLECLSVQY